jgi:hypothetical protein
MIYELHSEGTRPSPVRQRYVELLIGAWARNMLAKVVIVRDKLRHASLATNSTCIPTRSPA